MEPDGIFGNPLVDLLHAEGHYTFHAIATFGDNCTASRETLWTVHVDTGVDSGQTVIQTAGPIGKPRGS
jgi:hypothetical protein